MRDYIHKNRFETDEDLILQMLYYDRIDISEKTDFTETNKSKQCMICHCWFFNYEFKFQDSVCNGCHD